MGFSFKKITRAISKPFEQIGHAISKHPTIAGAVAFGIPGALVGGLYETQRAMKKAAQAEAASAERIANAMSTQPTVVSNVGASAAYQPNEETAELNAAEARRRRYSLSSTAYSGSALRRVSSSMGQNNLRKTLA